MPTESEFRSAASRVWRKFEDMERLAGGLRGSLFSDMFASVSLVLLGPSTLAYSVEEGMRTIRRDYAMAGSKLIELATECERRAQVCADHQVAVAEWRWQMEDWGQRYRAHVQNLRNAPHPGPKPEYPETEPWVELE